MDDQQEFGTQGGEPPPALECVWFSETSKHAFIPGSQAPRLSTSALARSFSTASPGQAVPLLGPTRAPSSVSFPVQINTSSKTNSGLLICFYFPYLDIKIQHFNPLKKLNWVLPVLNCPTPDRSERLNSFCRKKCV